MNDGSAPLTGTQYLGILFLTLDGIRNFPAGQLDGLYLAGPTFRYECDSFFFFCYTRDLMSFFFPRRVIVEFGPRQPIFFLRENINSLVRQSILPASTPPLFFYDEASKMHDAPCFSLFCGSLLHLLPLMAMLPIFYIRCLYLFI